MEQTSPSFSFVGCFCDDTPGAAFRAIPETAANWNGFFAVFAAAVPVVSILGCFVKNAVFVGEPEDERGFTPAIGDITLEVANGAVNGLFQPFDGYIWVQSIHRGFESGDDERAIIDEFKRAVRPTGLL